MGVGVASGPVEGGVEGATEVEDRDDEREDEDADRWDLPLTVLEKCEEWLAPETCDVCEECPLELVPDTCELCELCDEWDLWPASRIRAPMRLGLSTSGGGDPYAWASAGFATVGADSIRSGGGASAALTPDELASNAAAAPATVPTFKANLARRPLRASS